MQYNQFTCDYRMSEAYFKEILIGQSEGHQFRLIGLGLASIAFAIFGHFNGHSLSSTILWTLIGVFLMVGVLFAESRRKGQAVIESLKGQDIDMNYNVFIQIDNNIRITEDGVKKEYRFRDISGVRDTDRFIIIYFGEKRDLRVPVLKSALVGGSVKNLKDWIHRQIQVKA